MKQIVRVVVAIGAALYFIGCAKPQIDMIEDLRNATLGLDRSKSVGQAFREYEYFSSVLWHQEEADIITITGIVALERLERVNPNVQRASITYRFTKEDGEYALKDVLLQMQKQDAALDVVMDQNSSQRKEFYKPLQMVYQNRFFTR